MKTINKKLLISELQDAYQIQSHILKVKSVSIFVKIIVVFLRQETQMEMGCALIELEIKLW